MHAKKKQRKQKITQLLEIGWLTGKDDKVLHAGEAKRRRNAR